MTPTPETIYGELYEHITRTYAGADGDDVIQALLVCVAAIIAYQRNPAHQWRLAREANGAFQELLAHALDIPLPDPHPRSRPH